jgi:hypothetical protein
MSGAPKVNGARKISRKYEIMTGTRVGVGEATQKLVAKQSGTKFENNKDDKVVKMRTK